MTGAPELATSPAAAGAAAGEGAPDVCLVTMPYASPTRPSMALGLLKAILAEGGISASVAYANLWFAESVGLRRYSLCASNMPIVFLAGEWTFAAAAFGDDPRRAERDAEYLRQIRAASDGYPQVWSGARGREFIADLLALREAATAFVDEAARRVLATGARVVGCTSTFEQHVASLALLRRIRELDPGVITMLGGANCETVMGEATHRCFPWVDYVVSGEADGLVTELCRLALSRGRDVPAGELPRGVLGPAHRETTELSQPGGAGARLTGHRKPRHKLARALFSDLDSLPTPRYEDYFAALATSKIAPHVRPGLPLESSRGCWWGAAHQCTFCGLNGTSLGYRSKSPERVLAEVRELEDRYGVTDFEAVDNILDMAYHKTLLPELAADARERRPQPAAGPGPGHDPSPGPGPRRIFFEIKANVSRAQVAALVDAGIMWVQPGIESLHSEVLKLMDKGIQGWQNVQLLKWARELGLRLSWSILWGFPGEKDDWYEDMAQWLPAMTHLPPPAATPRVRFDRYSVYHEQASRLGLILFPIGTLSLVYPAGPGDLDSMAYFFTTEPNSGPLRIIQTLDEAVTANPGVRAVTQAVRDWSAAHRGGDLPVLTREDRAGVLEITDTRACARTPRQLLTGLARAVLLACDNAPRPARLAELVSRDAGLAASQDEIDAVVRQLLGDRLVLAMDERLVSLVLRGPVPDRIPGYSEFPGGGLVATAASGGLPATAAGKPDAESR
ncbi:MAG TPA: RiPP maturation radical SAM C-methyltransferase [Streptosporangiaceae bacterium]|nr:RiPP maturation radical SAM C-methyltransferase [Streptosporangiaceae bacterium]